MTDKDYFTVRIKRDPFEKIIERYMDENQGFTSKADAVRDMLRKYIKEHQD